MYKKFKKIMIKKLKRIKYMFLKIDLKIKFTIRRMKNYGKNYECNICKSHVKNMEASGHKHEIFEKNKIIGAGYREHCICPVCYSKDKARLVYYYIENYTDILTQKRTILHFAPEGPIRKKIKQNKKVRYFDADISPEVGEIIVDITNMQFEDDSFDYIICNHVLEHIVDEEKAILELKRVIKPRTRKNNFNCTYLYIK